MRLAGVHDCCLAVQFRNGPRVYFGGYSVPMKFIMNHSVSTLSGRKKLKIVLLGNQSVGKSSVISRYVHQSFDQHQAPTVGIDYLAKTVTFNNKLFRVQLWDTAGQQRFRSVIPGYLRDANCAIILFDVTSRTSLNHTDTWLTLYNESKSGDGTTLLVGNKIDLIEQRQISEKEGRQKAQELGVAYYEISAKSGQNIEELFNSILERECGEKTQANAGKNLMVVEEEDANQPIVLTARQQREAVKVKNCC